MVLGNSIILASGHPDAFICIVPLFIVLAVAMIGWSYSRSTSLIQKWARENGLVVQDMQRRYLRTGPFFLRRSKGQTVYWIRVKDSTERYRTAYIRCGGWFLGLWTDQVTVEWES